MSNPKPSDTASSARRWSAQRHVIAGLVLAVGLFSGVGLWASQAMIAGAVIAPGQLRVDGKRKEVSHLQGGVVEAILVRDGDRVAAGDVLLRLDPSAAAAQLEIVEGQLDELMARRARLLAEQADLPEIIPDPELADRVVARPEAAALLAGQIAIFEANRMAVQRQASQLREQIVQTHQQIAGFDAQREAAELQLELVREELVDRRSLYDKGLSPKAFVTELRGREAALVGELGTIRFRTAEAGARIAEIELRILEISAERGRVAATDLREAGALANELREQRNAILPALRRMDIVAPQAGVVLNMAVNTVGGVVAAAEPILSIVPEDERLVVETRIDAIARDRVWAGQSARIRFPGFNQRTTPEVAGEIRQIAADALIDERTGASYFLAEIQIPDAELQRLRATIDMDLTPGMPTEVLIQTEERTAGSYIMKPLTDNLERAFREE